MTARRRVALAVLVMAMGVGIDARADIATGKFGKAQVFDVQWNCNYPGPGCDFQPHPGIAVQYSFSSLAQPVDGSQPPVTHFDIGTGYVQFAPTGSNGPHGLPGYSLTLYTAGGAFVRVIDATGEFYAVSATGAFYLGNNAWGTLITFQQGLAYGASLNFTSSATLTPATVSVSGNTLGVGQNLAVPSLSTWAAMALMALVAAFGLQSIRRRESNQLA